MCVLYRRNTMFAIAFLAHHFVSHPRVYASDQQLRSRLQAEADRLSNSPASALFGSLTNERGKALFRLTDKQISLTRRLDEWARAMLKEQLLRGLQEPSPPPAEDLARRLGGEAERLREELIGHAEAMVLGVILDPDQARQVQRRVRRRPVPAPVNRYGPYRLTGCQPVETSAQLQSELDQERRVLEHGHTSYLFASLGAQDHSQRRLSASQIQLGGRLDQLSREILLGRLSREAVADRVPEADWDAAAWFDAWDRRRGGFVAHAEALLLRGVLTPKQSEDLLISFWRSMGPLALWDPQLADYLKLTQTQRFLLPERFAKRVFLEEEAAGLMALLGSKERDQLGREVGQVAREHKQRLLAEADWAVLEILTPAQLKRLNRVMGIDFHAPQPYPGDRSPRPNTERPERADPRR